MKRLMDRLQGLVRLRVTGSRPEQFLNLLAAAGIPFCELERMDAMSLSLCVHHRHLPRAKRLAAKAWCETEAVGESGLPSLKKRLKKRCALLAIPLLAVLSALTLSLFIWEIEITGNETVSDAAILSALRTEGIRIGRIGYGIDRELLRSKVIAALPKLSWLTVNVKGCRAEVIVRERTEPPELIDGDAPADIIAGKSGLITELHVMAGAVQTEQGATVLEGELLIAGTVPSTLGHTRYLRSRGEVTARTWYEFSEKMPLNYISKVYTGAVKQKKSLIIGNYRINLYRNGGISLDAYDKMTVTERVSLPGGMLLPVGLVTSEYREYRAVPAAMAEEDAESELKVRLVERLSERMDGEPLSLDFDTTVADGFITVTLRAECLEDIARTVPFQP